MITVGTQQIRDKWHCFATIQGCDESFEGNTIGEAQQPMKNLLAKNKIVATFTEPKAYIHTPKPAMPKIGYGYSKIDHL